MRYINLLFLLFTCILTAESHQTLKVVTVQETNNLLAYSPDYTVVYRTKLNSYSSNAARCLLQL